MWLPTLNIDPKDMEVSKNEAPQKRQQESAEGLKRNIAVTPEDWTFVLVDPSLIALEMRKSTEKSQNVHQDVRRSYANRQKYLG